MPQKVTTRIEGIAASMASVIALAGDVVTMSENSLYMIHNVWGGEVGDAKDLRKAADLMDKMGDRLVSIYMSKSGKSEEQIRSWMNEETWFNSSEAVENGFVDKIEEPIKLAARFDINKYDYKNKTLVSNLFNNIKKESNMENEFENLKTYISELFNKKGAEVKEVKNLDNDGVVEKSFIEPGISDNCETDPYGETSPENVFNYIIFDSPVKAKPRDLQLELFDGGSTSESFG